MLFEELPPPLDACPDDDCCDDPRGFDDDLEEEEWPLLLPELLEEDVDEERLTEGVFA